MVGIERPYSRHTAVASLFEDKCVLAMAQYPGFKPGIWLESTTLSPPSPSIRIRSATAVPIEVDDLSIDSITASQLPLGSERVMASPISASLSRLLVATGRVVAERVVVTWAVFVVVAVTVVTAVWAVVAVLVDDAEVPPVVAEVALTTGVAVDATGATAALLPLRRPIKKTTEPSTSTRATASTAMRRP